MRPGRGGVTYLTDIEYAAGWKAANELAITGKPVELRVKLDLGDAVPSAPDVVQYIRDGAGRLLRAGGGREVTVAVEIDADQTNWFTLDAP